MIKKIALSLLKPGMFIHDLDCGWLDHPFLRSRFRIDSEDQIGKIAANGIRELYIDTVQGLDVADAPTTAEVRAELEQEMIEVAQAKSARVPTAPPARNSPGRQEPTPKPTGSSTPSCKTPASASRSRSRG